MMSSLYEQKLMQRMKLSAATSSIQLKSLVLESTSDEDECRYPDRKVSSDSANSTRSTSVTSSVPDPLVKSSTKELCLHDLASASYSQWEANDDTTTQEPLYAAQRLFAESRRILAYDIFDRSFRLDDEDKGGEKLSSSWGRQSRSARGEIDFVLSEDEQTSQSVESQEQVLAERRAAQETFLSSMFEESEIEESNKFCNLDSNHQSLDFHRSGRVRHVSFKLERQEWIIPNERFSTSL